MRETRRKGDNGEDLLAFVEKILHRSGLGQSTYLPDGMMCSDPPDLSFTAARKEAATMLLGAVDGLLCKTGVRAKDIGVVIVNCGVYNQTPSLSAVIVDHYGLGDSTITYNLSGMGCTASLIAVGLAKNLLQGSPPSSNSADRRTGLGDRRAELRVFPTEPALANSGLLASRARTRQVRAARQPSPHSPNQGCSPAELAFAIGRAESASASPIGFSPPWSSRGSSGHPAPAAGVPAELREEILGLVRTALDMRAESATPAVPVVASPALGDDAPLRRPGKEPAERGERD
ncbi:3-ketoacyl-CoA synthase 17 [Platanthera zijinensis]|uniref:3-ketoacyl-CoA synthase 17 n=1 Tax=Platanthera zijinensis TaxID=2320716 RepID=A0AAP0B2I5_9ASPA